MAPAGPRPFTRAQSLQNRQFLIALRRTGNVHEAARSLGLHRSLFTRRRRSHPAFASDWDAALALAAATLTARGVQHAPAEGPRPHLVRRANGRLQLRAKVKGGLTPAAEQAFLAALSATANVRLSARAAGFCHAAFYHRARTHQGFAREWRLALQAGYERLETALLATVAPESYADDGWRHNDPPPMPAMTPNQALQLMYLHQKEARLLAEPAHFKRRRGETSEAQSCRYAVMYELRQAREREKFAIAEAERRARGESSPFEPAPPQLPALDQVTGWSKADAGKPPHDAGRALFGGWRLGDEGGRGE